MKFVLHLYSFKFICEESLQWVRLFQFCSSLVIVSILYIKQPIVWGNIECSSFLLCVRLFPQHWCREFWSYGMLHCVTELRVHNALKEHSAFVFEQSWQLFKMSGSCSLTTQHNVQGDQNLPHPIFSEKLVYLYYFICTGLMDELGSLLQYTCPRWQVFLYS
jgi:hypothetical protein